MTLLCAAGPNLVHRPVSAARIVLPLRQPIRLSSLRPRVSRINADSTLGGGRADSDSLSCKPSSVPLLASAALLAAVGMQYLAPGRAHAAVASPSMPPPGPATAEVARTPLASVTSAQPNTLTASEGVGYLLQYRLLQVLSLPTTGKVAALVCVGLPLVVTGAALHRWASGANWEESLTKVYYVLNSVPGIDISAEDSKRAIFVLNLMHVASLFTFAILVGILTDEVARGVEAVRTGNHAVPEQRHTVIVGWDKAKTPLLLKQLLQAHEERGIRAVRPPYVVLLDPTKCSKEEVDLELEECIGRTLGREVVTRQGSALDPGDLQRVSAGQAGTVILTNTETEGKMDNTSTLVATLAALHSVGSTSIAQSVVVESGVGLGDWDSSPAGTAVCRMLASKGRRVTAVADTRDLTDVLAQVAMHKGLGAVFEEVCLQGPENSEFYIKKTHPFQGLTFKDARHSYRSAVLCGVIELTSGVARLNPADSYVIGPTDALVFLAQDSKQIQTPSSVDELMKSGYTGPLPYAPKSHAKTQQIVVLMHEPEGAMSLLTSLMAVGQERAFVTLVGRAPDNAAQTQALETVIREVRRSGCSLTWIKEEPSNQSALLSAGVATAQTVVVAPPAGHWTVEDIDAQVLSHALQLTEILHHSQEPRRAPLRLVAGVMSDGSREVIHSLIDTTRALEVPGTTPGSVEFTKHPRANHTLVAEVLRLDNLTIGLLGQVAAEPLLQGVFTELLSQEGAELYTRRPGYFGLETDKPVTWEQVSEVVRANGELAVGVVDSLGRVVLGEEAFALESFGPEDRLVVLADE